MTHCFKLSCKELLDKIINFSSFNKTSFAHFTFRFDLKESLLHTFTLPSTLEILELII